MGAGTIVPRIVFRLSGKRMFKLGKKKFPLSPRLSGIKFCLVSDLNTVLSPPLTAQLKNFYKNLIFKHNYRNNEKVQNQSQKVSFLCTFNASLFPSNSY
jgi:hypothetical protein